MSSTKIKVNGTTVRVIAGEGYTMPGNTLVKVKDTGNGFVAKFPKWSCAIGDEHYVCLNYSQAADLYQALKEYDKMGGYFEED